MQSVSRRFLQPCPVLYRTSSAVQLRYASLTAAINKGIRKGHREIERHEQGQRQQTEDVGFDNQSDGERKPSFRATNNQKQLQSSLVKASTRDDPGFKTAGRALPRYAQRVIPTIWKKSSASIEIGLVKPPSSVPYTTAESEFLFGTFTIEAAIRAKRRKFYRLYIYHGQTSKARPELLHSDLRKLASHANIEIVDVGLGWESVLARMTSSRPHNGYILEASPIPKLSTTSLQNQESPESALLLQTDRSPQSVDNSVEMSAHQSNLFPNTPRQHYPFMLLLDRIVDPGNFGAILRSAYFFGVDAVVILEHGTAPLSGITSKASAGAMEFLPLLQVKNEVDFIKRSKTNGWKFFAAVPQDQSSSGSVLKRSKTSEDSVTTALSSSPCVLMLGNEGDGLRPHIEKLATDLISIPGSEGRAEVVDSLNVSVAAALFIRDFLSNYRTG